MPGRWPGKTISEKILSQKSGVDAYAGDVVICELDYALGTDASTPMAIEYFHAMGGDSVSHPERIAFEVVGCDERIQSELGLKPGTFAYPYGALSDAAVSMIASRYAWGCTTDMRTIQKHEARALPRGTFTGPHPSRRPQRPPQDEG